MSQALVLADLLRRAGWSPEKLAREINRRRGAGTISAKAPYHWIKGTYPRRDIPSIVCELLSEQLDEEIGIETIWPQRDLACEPDVVRVGSPSLESRSSRKFLFDCSLTSIDLAHRQSSSYNSDPLEVSRVRFELGDICTSYLHTTPAAVLPSAVELRNRLSTLLGTTKHPEHYRALLVCAAKSCALLAWFSDDLGHLHAARNHAGAAWKLAELADSDEVRRWVKVVQARSALFELQFTAAARFSADGLSYGPADPHLRLLGAKAWADARMTGKARALLESWVPPAEAPGDLLPENQPFTLSPHRQFSLAGSALLSLGSPREALSHFGVALEHAEKAPQSQRFVVAEALTRMEAARAHLLAGESADAIHVLEPVFALGADQCVKAVGWLLRQLHSTSSRFSGRDADTRELGARLAELLARTRH